MDRFPFGLQMPHDLPRLQAIGLDTKGYNYTLSLDHYFFSLDNRHRIDYNAGRKSLQEA
jgi:hypothetical protein